MRAHPAAKQGTIERALLHRTARARAPGAAKRPNNQPGMHGSKGKQTRPNTGAKRGHLHSSRTSRCACHGISAAAAGPEKRLPWREVTKAAPAWLAGAHSRQHQQKSKQQQSNTAALSCMCATAITVSCVCGCRRGDARHGHCRQWTQAAALAKHTNVCPNTQGTIMTQHS